MSELGKYEEGRLIIPEGFFGRVDDNDTVVIIEDFVSQEHLDQSYEYAIVADMKYDGGAGGSLKDRVHESYKFKENNSDLFQTMKETYALPIKTMLEEKHGIELTGSKCTELHKPLSDELQDKIDYLVTSSQCGCQSEVSPFIVGWTEGTSQKEHTDNGNDFTAIMYLNDNYEGGELNFPGLDISIKPKKGSLIIWPGYLTHSISEISSGTRYTMPIFLKAIDTTTE
jgi:hypothetical protein